MPRGTQQKIHLTADEKTRLRRESEARDLNMSEVVGHLITEGAYPEKKDNEESQ